MSVKSLELEHMQKTWLGWQCPNCLIIKPNDVGAIWHEEDIDSGKCKKEEGEE